MRSDLGATIRRSPTSAAPDPTDSVSRHICRPTRCQAVGMTPGKRQGRTHAPAPASPCGMQQNWSGAHDDRGHCAPVRQAGHVRSGRLDASGYPDPGLLSRPRGRAGPGSLWGNESSGGAAPSHPAMVCVRWTRQRAPPAVCQVGHVRGWIKLGSTWLTMVPCAIHACDP